MRFKRLLMVVVAFAAIAVPAGYGCSTDACVDLIHQYYADGTFSGSVVGYWEHDCDFNTTQWGTFTDWRRTDTYGCGTGNHTVHCGHWNGTSWDSVTCP